MHVTTTTHKIKTVPGFTMFSARYTQEIPFQDLSLFYYVIYQRDRYRITLNYKAKATDHSYREGERERERELGCRGKTRRMRYKHRYEIQIKRRGGQ